MKTLKDFNFQNKRVLVRCDFNVPIENGRVVDDFKIQKALDTITYLRRQGAKIVLGSHLGWPQQVKSKKQRFKNYSLLPIRKRLEELLKEPIKFSKKVVGKKAQQEAKKLKPGEILLLENLRFEKGEEENDEKFAKELARFGEVYINEAFSECHRNYASIAALPKLLPHFAGLNLAKEVEVLSGICQDPERPLVVVIGGIKIASKIKVLEKFLEAADPVRGTSSNGADHLLFGGKIANVILRVKGICPGLAWPNEEIVKRLEKLNLTDPKVHLPVDVLACPVGYRRDSCGVCPDESGQVYIRETAPGSVRKDEDIFDIGKGTEEAFGEILKSAKTIFWSGPLGLYENEKFSQGTKSLAEAIIRNHNAFRVVGGGNTIAFLRKLNLLDRFSFVSTGGGAMLAFLAGERLPGIEALKT